LKTIAKILLATSFVLLLPEAANAQGKGMTCAVFASATIKSAGDSASATAAVSKAGYVLTGGGCNITNADGSLPAKPPTVYQSQPQGSNWVCRARNGSGAPIPAYAITAYAVGCGS
jgi:hypothetical protein